MHNNHQKKENKFIIKTLLLKKESKVLIIPQEKELV